MTAAWIRTFVLFNHDGFAVNASSRPRRIKAAMYNSTLARRAFVDLLIGNARFGSPCRSPRSNERSILLAEAIRTRLRARWRECPGEPGTLAQKRKKSRAT